ncbi:ABC transporter permease subunit [Bacillus sp. BGMRC 2118]|nr:ABC transporter permease subunit [Bacillus sp. BGMRC 2118]
MIKYVNNIQLLTGILFLIILLYIVVFPTSLPNVDTKLERILYTLGEDKKPIMPPFPPSSENIFGTDHEGKDLYSLLVLGAKETLLYVFFISGLRFLLGIPLSFLAVNKIAKSDSLLKLMNQIFIYVPSIVTIIIFMTLPPILFSDFRPILVVIIITLVELNKVTSTLSDEINKVYQMEYIKAAISLGTNPIQIVRRYVFPQLFPHILVTFSLDIARNFVILAQLGFFQFFISHIHVQDDKGQWSFANTSLMWPNHLGNILSDIRGPIWIPFFATLAITFSIITFNLLANGLSKQFVKKYHY